MWLLFVMMNLVVRFSVRQSRTSNLNGGFAPDLEVQGGRISYKLPIPLFSRYPCIRVYST